MDRLFGIFKRNTQLEGSIPGQGSQGVAGLKPKNSLSLGLQPFNIELRNDALLHSKFYLPKVSVGTTISSDTTRMLKQRSSD